MNVVDEKGATPPPIKVIVLAVVASLLVTVFAVVGLALLVNTRASDAVTRAEAQQSDLDALSSAVDRAETADDQEKAYEEGLKRYICSLPAPPDYTAEQLHRRDQFCALPPQIDLQKYLDEHS